VTSPTRAKTMPSARPLNGNPRSRPRAQRFEIPSRFSRGRRRWGRAAAFPLSLSPFPPARSTKTKWTRQRAGPVARGCCRRAPRPGGRSNPGAGPGSRATENRGRDADGKAHGPICVFDYIQKKNGPAFARRRITPSTFRHRPGAPRQSTQRRVAETLSGPSALAYRTALGMPHVETTRAIRRGA